MKGIDTIKNWVAALTELSLMLLALAIVLAILVGSNLPFFGAVTNNLITLGIIFWLFSHRKLS